MLSLGWVRQRCPHLFRACVREPSSHSWPLTCLSPPPVCVYLLGTELDESFKEFGKNREVMGLCREGESSPLEGVCASPGEVFLLASPGQGTLPTLPTHPRHSMLLEEEGAGY